MLRGLVNIVFRSNQPIDNSTRGDTRSSAVSSDESLFAAARGINLCTIIVVPRASMCMVPMGEKSEDGQPGTQVLTWNTSDSSMMKSYLRTYSTSLHPQAGEREPETVSRPSHRPLSLAHTSRR